jgi:uncharacterized protein (TIGR03067 family)
MLTTLVLFALSAPTDPPKEKAKELPAEALKELKKLEGKWRLVKAANGDREAEAKECESIHFLFKGAELTMVSGDKMETIRVTAIDATTDPKCIDLTETRRDKTERTVEGIFKLDGDTLQLALSLPKEGKNRPTGFEKPGERTMVWTLKRVKE